MRFHYRAIASILLDRGAGDLPRDSQAFADGVKAAGQGALAHLLFGVRARVVCGDLAPASATAYLSGLLIGHELHDVVGSGAAVERFCIIGSPALATIYADAAQSHGLACEALDAAQLFIAAMQHFRSAPIGPVGAPSAL